MTESRTEVGRHPLRLFAVLVLALAVLACGACIATEEIVEKVDSGKEEPHGQQVRWTIHRAGA